jgi:hypothetical protein
MLYICVLLLESLGYDLADLIVFFHAPVKRGAEPHSRKKEKERERERELERERERERERDEIKRGNGVKKTCICRICCLVNFIPLLQFTPKMNDITHAVCLTLCSIITTQLGVFLQSAEFLHKISDYFYRATPPERTKCTHGSNCRRWNGVISFIISAFHLVTTSEEENGRKRLLERSGRRWDKNSP